MTDLPRIQSPYPNIYTPSGLQIDADKDSDVPEGPNKNKTARAQLALQGLIGAK